MFTQVLATREAATTKWWAAKDAALRSDRNKSLWNSNQVARATEVHVLAQLFYHARGFYVSYGTLGISIKVDGARIRDHAGLARFEKDLHKKGIRKKISAQGVIYRLVF
jgi:hypothetical protein